MPKPPKRPNALVNPDDRDTDTQGMRLEASRWESPPDDLGNEPEDESGDERDDEWSGASGQGAADIPNQPTLVPTREQVVDFYGEPITIAWVDDVPFVALRMFTEYLGLGWASQYQRTLRDEVLEAEIRPVTMTGADQRQREMVGLPLEYLPGWLFGVTPRRVRPELRPKVLLYRRQCFKVLWREVQADLLRSREVVTSGSVSAVEIAEQIRELTGVIGFLREHLHTLLQLPMQVEALSTQLSQALALLARLAERQQETETQVAATGAQLAEVDQRTKGLTPAHKRAIIDLVQDMVALTRQQPTPLTFAKIYGSLNRRFHAAGYAEIPAERFEEAMAFLRDVLRRETGGEAPEQGTLFR